MTGIISVARSEPGNRQMTSMMIPTVIAGIQAALASAAFGPLVA